MRLEKEFCISDYHMQNYQNIGNNVQVMLGSMLLPSCRVNFFDVKKSEGPSI